MLMAMDDAVGVSEQDEDTETVGREAAETQQQAVMVQDKESEEKGKDSTRLEMTRPIPPDPARQVREYLQQRDDARRAVDAAVASEFYSVLDRVAELAYFHAAVRLLHRRSWSWSWSRSRSRSRSRSQRRSRSRSRNWRSRSCLHNIC
jgi:hypothetical protein